MSRTPLDRWRTIRFIAWTKVISITLDELRLHTKSKHDRSSTNLGRELYIALAQDAQINSPFWLKVLGYQEKAIMRLIKHLKIAVDLREKEKDSD